MSLDDRDKAANMSGVVFFDRGLIDACSALEHATRKPVLLSYASERYNRKVFVAPPWPEIYINDEERRHDLYQAIAEYERLIAAFEFLKYDVEILPKVGVAKRADIVLDRLLLI